MNKDSFNGILITLIVLGSSLGLVYYISFWQQQNQLLKPLDIEINPNLPKFVPYNMTVADNALKQIAKLYPTGNVTAVFGKKVGDRQYFELIISPVTKGIAIKNGTYNTTWSCIGDCSQ